MSPPAWAQHRPAAPQCPTSTGCREGRCGLVTWITRAAGLAAARADHWRADRGGTRQRAGGDHPAMPGADGGGRRRRLQRAERRVGLGRGECITTDGNADFTVANSAISNATNGAPAPTRPSTRAATSASAPRAGCRAPRSRCQPDTGKVTSSWSTTQPGGSNDYDVAYDVWFNHTATTSGQPNGTELMVWLNHNGPVQPSAPRSPPASPSAAAATTCGGQPVGR